MTLSSSFSHFPFALSLAALLLLPFTALHTGCGGSQKGPESRFDEQVRAFHGHMRWGRWEDAADYVQASHRFDFLGELEEYGDDYEVTEYEIRGVTMVPSEQRAQLRVWVQSFRLPSTRVEEVTWIEDWKWNEDRRMWELEERRKRD